MMEVKQIRVSYGESVRIVAIYKDIFTEELSKLLSAVFEIDGSVIGLLGEVY